MADTIRALSWNVNGLRAALRKGFLEWFSNESPGILCLQETKATVDQLPDNLKEVDGYHSYFCSAERKGYSGVALYSRAEPKRVVYGLGAEEFDAEGRYVEAIFDNVAIVSVYLPSGSAGEHRQASKYRFLDLFERHLATLRRKSVPYILCGDFNIAHKEMDLKNWRSNRKNSGFLPDERAWMDRALTTGGFVDAFRVVNQEPEQYTWWSNRGQARQNNVGWRLDYHLVTPELEKKIDRVAIYKNKWYSDHAPLTIDYDWEL